MPELPDVTVYIEALRSRIAGQVLREVKVASPFVLRSVDPPISAAGGHTVTGIERLGKRVVIGLDGDLWIVIHLMIAGRFRWLAPGKKPPGKLGLAGFVFDPGTLWLTEAGPSGGHPCTWWRDAQDWPNLRGADSSRWR